MISISKEALACLTQQLATEGNDTSAIRIAVMGGASTSGLGLIVDTPKESDLCFQHGTIPIIIDQHLLEFCRSISISFISGEGSGCTGKKGSGFLIIADNPIV